MADAGIDFGVFGPITKSSDESKTTKRAAKFANGVGNGSTNDHTANGDDPAAAGNSDEEEGAEEGEERKSRAVIKLRPPRHRNPSRSRSRRDLSRVAEDDRRPQTPDATDFDSVANVRFSAHIIAKTDISSLLPFALITPENKKRRKRQKAESVLDTPATPMPGAMGVAQQSSPATEDGHESHSPQMMNSVLSPVSPASVQSQSVAAKQLFLQGPPADMKGVFVRKFRWGTVDVLDPKHCDFAAMRTAILSTHLKVSPKLVEGGSDQRLTGWFRFSKCIPGKYYTKNIGPKSCLRDVLLSRYPRRKGIGCYKVRKLIPFFVLV